ncbi:hypothetical protein BCR44DRAFT_1423881, partial [Catenaria anguillulae PL171]
ICNLQTLFAGTAAAATGYLAWSALFKRKPDPSPFAYGPNTDLVVARSYTPVHVRDGTLQLLVKRYSVGETGKWMHRQQPGGVIEVCGPLNEWVLPEPSDKDGSTLAMIAGGTGVTPFIQILDAALNTPTAPTATNAAKWSKFHLAWLDAMAAKYPDRLAVRLPPPGRGLTVVCGPDGFVRAIAGSRGRDLISQGPLGGMLAAMGYSASDVYKMQ